MLHCMRSRVYETVGRLSVCLSVRPWHSDVAGLLMWFRRAGRRYQSIAARPALSSRCDQCHVVSWRTAEHADLFVVMRLVGEAHLLVT